MKTLKSIILIIIPVFLLSCNSQPNNERATASDSNRDVSTSDRDARDRDAVVTDRNATGNREAGNRDATTGNRNAASGNREVTSGNREATNIDTTRKGENIRIDAMTNENRGDVNDFIKEVASGSSLEIQLGKYAQQNAVNQRVKNFGAMMVRDHTKASEQLKSIAQQKNIIIPTALVREHNDMLSDLQEKRGAEFDKEYMKMMVDDHQKDVDNFKKYAEDGDDSELKSFAAKTLPLLLAHQDSAKSIRDALR